MLYIIMGPQKQLQKAVSVPQIEATVLLYPSYLQAYISTHRLNYGAKWIYIDFSVVTADANMYT